MEGLSAMATSSQEVAPNILLLQFTIVTACIVSDPGAGESGNWVLVDTGLENSADFIIKTAEQRFGRDSRPSSIILTHGHFDHVGSVIKLAELWNVPVFAHELELPYITGKKDYPVADPTVSNGLVAKMSPTFPHTSIDIGFHAAALPSDGSVPGLAGWKWIHTPGHTEGHVSFFREKNRLLIAGDAFTTVKQDSLLSVITQREQISGPPPYLTTDWKAAEESVKRIRDLKPSLAILSHGQPMKGKELTRHLEMLAHHFEDIAVPEQGRFVDKQ